jgi:hypothetical protein
MITTAVEIEQVLKDLSFPVEKKIILTYVQDLQSTNPKANQILPQLLTLDVFLTLTISLLILLVIHHLLFQQPVNDCTY